MAATRVVKRVVKRVLSGFEWLWVYFVGLEVFGCVWVCLGVFLG